MSRGWKHQLTEEAKRDRAEFREVFAGEGCRCAFSAPCSFCTHPGNPASQDEDDECWEVIHMIHTKQIKKKQHQVHRAIKAFKGRRLTPELADTIKHIVKFGPRFGWNRTCRKRAKMEVRGTYRPSCQWKIERAAKAAERAAKTLRKFILESTPGNAPNGYQERCMQALRDGPSVLSMKWGPMKGQEVIEEDVKFQDILQGGFQAADRVIAARAPLEGEVLPAGRPIYRDIEVVGEIAKRRIIVGYE